jgi:hypothetical protein
MKEVILCIFICHSCLNYGQVTDNFGDKDLTKNPTWSGNLDHFITNAEGLLQLNAPIAGRSLIYTPSALLDSFSFEIEVALEFSPSASNYSRLYFHIDNIDPAVANGYYLNLGENGSNDAIRLYRLTRGSSTLLASGTLGKIANNTNNFTISLSYSQENLKLQAKYGNEDRSNEFVLKEMLSPKPQGFFAIECVYTSTRTDKFFFDNLNLKRLVPDTIPPVFEKAIVESPTRLDLTFSESIKVPAISQIRIKPNIPISSVVIDPLQDSKTRINLASSIPEGSYFTIEVDGIEDLKSNKSKLQSKIFGIFKEAGQGELIITEILFDPVNGGDDYLEIYNISDKILDLNGLTISNPSRNETKKIVEKLLISPKSYLCFNKNPNQIISQYKPSDNASFFAFTLPSFLNEGGKALILNSIGLPLDSMSYDAGMHDALINDTEGVSLERIKDQSNVFTNSWKSGVEKTNFGTPGYENSQSLSNKEGLELTLADGRTFSPNNDGFQDEIEITYQLPSPGYYAEIIVFDAEGRNVKNLASNFGLGTSGKVKWDGKDEEGKLCNIGVYIISFNTFAVSEKSYSSQISCILTSKN